MLSQSRPSNSCRVENPLANNQRFDWGWLGPEWNGDVPSDRQRLRAAATQLGLRLAQRLPGSVSYRCRLTDSGAAAMHAVLDHAYQARLKALRAIHDSIGDQVTDVWLRAVACVSLQVPGGKKLTEFLDDLEQRNLGALESFELRPVAFAFRGSSAGRGMSAVTVMVGADRNEVHRRPTVRTVFLDAQEPSHITHAIEVHRCQFLVPILSDGKIEVAVRRESLVFACILNPQSVAEGIGQLPAATMEWLAHGRGDLPLMIEETQIGCGGENGFYAFEQTPLKDARPEYVLLSRLLGGWGSRIGCGLIRSDILWPEFEVAEDACDDAFSLEVALAILDAIDLAE